MLLLYLVRYKFSILVAILIAVGSLVPGNNLPGSPLFNIPAFDKFAHFGMYALLGFMVLLESRNHIRGLRMNLLVILVLFLLGVVIEILQATLVPSRSAEWLDLVANFGGLIAGTVSFYILKRIIS